MLVNSWLSMNLLHQLKLLVALLSLVPFLNPTIQLFLHPHIIHMRLPLLLIPFKLLFQEIPMLPVMSKNNIAKTCFLNRAMIANPQKFAKDYFPLNFHWILENTNKDLMYYSTIS